MDYKTEMTKKSCVEKYGVENPFQLEEFKEKGKATMLELYGDTNPGGKNSIFRQSMNESLRSNGERRSKNRKITMQKKHGEGVTHWTQIPGQMDVFAKTMEKRHGKGITNIMHVKAVKEKHESIMADLTSRGVFKEAYKKVTKTTKERFGVDNIFKDVEFMKRARVAHNGFEFPLQDPKARSKFVNTCIERYGSNHPMHDADVAAKSFKANRKLHIYECSYKKRVFNVIGTYEVFVLRYLLKNYRPNDLRSWFDVSHINTGAKTRYFPDFYVKSLDTFIEVKSIYTLLGPEKFGYPHLKSSQKKARSCAEQGIKLVWLLPNPSKGTILQLPTDWYEFSPAKLMRTLRQEGQDIETVSEDQFQHRLLHSVGQVPVAQNRSQC